MLSNPADFAPFYSIVQTVAVVGGFFYFAGQLRADTRALKEGLLEVKRGHAELDERVRAVEIEVH